MKTKVWKDFFSGMKIFNNLNKYELFILVLFSSVILFNLPVYEYSSFGSNDFIEYWSAGQFWLEGESAYQSEKMFSLQKLQGLSLDSPIMMWNPPWTLFFLFHTLNFPFLIAAKLWLITNLVLLYFSAYFVSQSLDYNFKPGLLFAFFSILFFYPVLSCLEWGQVGVLMLFGVSGFLFSFTRKYDFLAGLFLCILSIKPHLYSLLFIAVLHEIIKFKRWRIVLGSLLGLSVLFISSYLVSPIGLSEWIASLFPNNSSGSAIKVTSWKVATFSGFIREQFHAFGLFGYDRIISIIICLLGALIYGGSLYKRAEPINWIKNLIPILAFSLFFAPHGWPYDFSVLAIGQLIILILCLKNKQNKIKIFSLLSPLLFLQLICLILIQAGMVEQQKYFWFPVVFSLLYLSSYNQVYKSSS